MNLRIRNIYLSMNIIFPTKERIAAVTVPPSAVSTDASICVLQVNKDFNLSTQNLTNNKTYQISTFIKNKTKENKKIINLKNLSSFYLSKFSCMISFILISFEKISFILISLNDKLCMYSDK